MVHQELKQADAILKGRKRHSIQGVISFFLAITLLATLLGLIIVIGPAHFWSMRKHMGFGSAPLVLGCGTAFGFFLVIVGVGLGLSGLAKPDTNRFYPILGIIGNVVWATIIGLLILID